jgi:hypothetical protein
VVSTADPLRPLKHQYLSALLSFPIVIHIPGASITAKQATVHQRNTSVNKGLENSHSMQKKKNVSCMVRMAQQLGMVFAVWRC